MAVFIDKCFLPISWPGSSKEEEEQDSERINLRKLRIDEFGIITWIGQNSTVSPGKFQMAKWTKWTTWTRWTQTKSAKAWVWSAKCFGENERKGIGSYVRNPSWLNMSLPCILNAFSSPGNIVMYVFGWLFDAWQPNGSYTLWAVVGSEDVPRGAEKDEAKRRALGSSA